MSEKVVRAVGTGGESDEDSECKMGGCLGQEDLELRLGRDEGLSHAEIWKTISDRGNSQYKCPKVGGYLEYWRKRKEAKMA